MTYDIYICCLISYVYCDCIWSPTTLRTSSFHFPQMLHSQSPTKPPVFAWWESPAAASTCAGPPGTVCSSPRPRSASGLRAAARAARSASTTATTAARCRGGSARTKRCSPSRTKRSTSRSSPTSPFPSPEPRGRTTSSPSRARPAARAPARTEVQYDKRAGRVWRAVARRGAVQSD